MTPAGVAPRARCPAWLLLAWLLLPGLLTIRHSIPLLEHYFLFVPPAAALLTGLCIDALSARRVPRFGRALLWLSTGAVVLAGVLHLITTVGLLSRVSQHYETEYGAPLSTEQRLAWDVAGNAFGSRQVLYERFFASDPLTRARAMAAIYPKTELMDRVREFLGRDQEP